MPTRTVWAATARAARNRVKRSKSGKRTITRVKMVKGAGSRGHRTGGKRLKKFTVTFRWKKGYVRHSKYADKSKYTARDRATRSRTQKHERRRRRKR